ncbi:MAG: hypothetical protein QOG90_2385 [Actinomycetota bacterium]|jgi:hypothetical protein
MSDATDTPLLGRQDAVPRRRWRWLLPLLVVAAVVALVASLVVRSQGGDDNSPKAVLDTYLTAVQEGDTAAAYARLCASSSSPSKSEFATQVARERQNFGGVIRHRMGSRKKLADGDETVSYTIQYHNTYRWYEARMTNKTGSWKVCGFKEIPRPDVRIPFEPLPTPAPGADTSDTTTTQ